MKLQAIASTVPPYQLSQEDCWNRLLEAHALDRLRPGSRALLEKFLLNDNGIDTRNLAIHDMDFLVKASPQELNQVYEQEVTRLGREALVKALNAAGLTAAELDALFVCSCTGYLCPGPGSYIAEAAGLSDSVYLFDLIGQGCGAAIPMLHAASAYLELHPDHRVACIAIEICSAAFYIDDDPGVLVSLALFGDGASASIWHGDSYAGNSNRKLQNFQTLHLPEARHTLRFINENGYLKNQLHRSVPETVGKAVAQLYHNSRITDTAHIISHSGGRNVLAAVESATARTSLAESREVLRRYGNMSSPSVLFALQEHLNTPTAREDLWLVSFGAGFTCHSARLIKN